MTFPGKKKITDIGQHPGACPHHNTKLIATKKGNQLVCPEADCDYHERNEAVAPLQPGVTPSDLKVTKVDPAVQAQFAKLLGVGEEKPKLSKKERKALKAARRAARLAKETALADKRSLQTEQLAVAAGLAPIEQPKPKKLTKEERRAIAKKVVTEMAPQIIAALTPPANTLATTIEMLKNEANEALRKKTEAFIDGPLKKLMNAFLVQFASRNFDGDSKEAHQTLNACVEAFDACGLVLADVEVKLPKKTPAKAPVLAHDEVAEVNAAPKKEAKTTTAIIKANTLKPENAKKARKPLTAEQREAKNKADRARRAANTKKGS